MLDRIRGGWEMTKKAWGVVRSHPGLAKLPLIGGAIAVIIFLVLGVPGAAVMSGDTTARTAGGVALLTVGAYLAWFAVIYFNVVLLAGASQALRGDEPDLQAARRVARGRAGTIAGWALVSVIVSLVFAALGERGGVAGRIGALLGGAIWALATFLMLPVLTFEGVGTFAAMRRSKELIHDHWGEAVTGSVVIGGVSELIAWLGVLVGVSGVVVFALDGVVAVVVGGLLVLVGMVVAIGGAIFAGATRGVFGVALYRYIADDHAIAPFTAAEFGAVARTR
jgi:hypothetical protein